MNSHIKSSKKKELNSNKQYLTKVKSTVTQQRSCKTNKVSINSNLTKVQQPPSKSKQLQEKSEEYEQSKIKEIPIANSECQEESMQTIDTIDLIDQKQEQKDTINVPKEKEVENEEKKVDTIVNQDPPINPKVQNDPEAKRVFAMIDETRRTCNSTLEKVNKTLEDLKLTRQNLTDVDQKMKQFMDDYSSALNKITDNLAISLEQQNFATLPFENDTKEYFDSKEEFSEKMNELVKLIKESKNIICFTGAGISTFSGIPDYRSTKETVLPTGPGVRSEGQNNEKFKPNLLPNPSLTHMTIKALEQRNILKTVISQNIDGLHIKSGIPRDKIMELHGNLQIQYCNKCGQQFFKDQKIKFNFPKNHKTGKACYSQQCDGELLDNIINFGESLNPQCIQKAVECAKNADLCLVLGSSLGVSPANTLVQIVKNNGKKVVIINLQKTQLDVSTDIRFFCYCDEVMKTLLQKLQIPIPSYEQVISKLKIINNNELLTFLLLNSNDEEIHWIQSIKITEIQTKDQFVLKKIPYQFQINNKNQLAICVTFDSDYSLNFNQLHNLIIFLAPETLKFNLNLNDLKNNEFSLSFINNLTSKQWEQIEKS